MSLLIVSMMICGATAPLESIDFNFGVSERQPTFCVHHITVVATAPVTLADEQAQELLRRMEQIAQAMIDSGTSINVNDCTVNSVSFTETLSRRLHQAFPQLVIGEMYTPHHVWYEETTGRMSIASELNYRRKFRDIVRDSDYAQPTGQL